jgi:hypothetical protein
MNAPHGASRGGVVSRRLKSGPLIPQVAKDAIGSLRAGSEQALIRIPVTCTRRVYSKIGPAVFLPSLGSRFQELQRRSRQLRHAVVEQARIVQHLVVQVVLRPNAEHARLDAQIDVLRHDYQRDRRAQDAVVGFASRERGRKGMAHVLGLKEYPSRVPVCGPARQGKPRADAVLIGLVDEIVEEPAHVPRVSRHLGHALLRRVQLFQYHHGQENVVFVKPEYGGRIVHQHVSVEKNRC